MYALPNPARKSDIDHAHGADVLISCLLKQEARLHESERLGTLIPLSPWLQSWAKQTLKMLLNTVCIRLPKKGHPRWHNKEECPKAKANWWRQMKRQLPTSTNCTYNMSWGCNEEALLWERFSCLQQFPSWPPRLENSHSTVCRALTGSLSTAFVLGVDRSIHERSGMNRLNVPRHDRIIWNN